LHIAAHHDTCLRLNVENVRQRLPLFVSALQRHGCPLKSWAFIDGTARQICRPSEGQEVAYSGHKRYHALKYQALITPDGMFADMYGPVEGRINNQGLLTASKLLDTLGTLEAEGGGPFVIYGDRGYAMQPRLICPHSEPCRNRNEKEFNLRMSKLRVCIEWSFNHILTLFSFLITNDTKRCFYVRLVYFFKWQ